MIFRIPIARPITRLNTLGEISIDEERRQLCRRFRYAEAFRAGHRTLHIFDVSIASISPFSRGLGSATGLLSHDIVELLPKSNIPATNYRRPRDKSAPPPLGCTSGGNAELPDAFRGTI